MSGDNPFEEPEDSDRTVIRPVPGGRKPAAATAELRNAPPPRAAVVRWSAPTPRPCGRGR